MRHLKTDIFDVSSFIPLPGTPAWEAVPVAEKTDIDWRKVGYKSFDNHFLQNVSADEFRRYMSEAYKIAGRTQRRTVIRMAARTLGDKLSSRFRH